MSGISGVLEKLGKKGWGWRMVLITQIDVVSFATYALWCWFLGAIFVHSTSDLQHGV